MGLGSAAAPGTLENPDVSARRGGAVRGRVPDLGAGDSSSRGAGAVGRETGTPDDGDGAPAAEASGTRPAGAAVAVAALAGMQVAAQQSRLQ